MVENVESWMITVIMMVGTFIATIAVMKQQGNNNKDELTKQNQHIEKLFALNDSKNKQITELEAEVKSRLTRKEADEIYQRISEFQMYVQHTDEKFNTLNKGQDEIKDLLKTLVNKGQV